MEQNNTSGTMLIRRLNVKTHKIFTSRNNTRSGSGPSTYSFPCFHQRYNFIAIIDIPVIGNINGGYYFNVMYLNFTNKQVVYSEIEGPIAVCEKVFNNTKTCGFMDE